MFGRDFDYVYHLVNIRWEQYINLTHVSHLCQVLQGYLFKLNPTVKQREQFLLEMRAANINAAINIKAMALSGCGKRPVTDVEVLQTSLVKAKGRRPVKCQDSKSSYILAMG